MTLEQQFLQRIRQLGYWDNTELINPSHSRPRLSLAWSNPNTTLDPEIMFNIVWLLSSSVRRQHLSPTDLRILDRTAAELASEGNVLPATKTYVKYLWQQVSGEEESKHF